MIAVNSWSGGTDEEYETQHFGFGVQRLQIAIRQMVEQKITTCVKDMETYLQESLDLNESDKTTLTHSCDKLIKLYCERAGPSLQIIDEEIERTISIPSNVLLSEDEIQSIQMSDEDYENLKEEVASLRKRVEQGALMVSLLTAEEEELSSLDKLCEVAKKDMDIIDLLHEDLDSDHCIKSIENKTRLLCADLPFMQHDNKNY